MFAGVTIKIVTNLFSLIFNSASSFFVNFCIRIPIPLGHFILPLVHRDIILKIVLGGTER